jgi:exopolysaccharide biosynthesis predicted pyruvyltransferase EpsI
MNTPAIENARAAALARLRGHMLQALRPLLAPGGRVALLDYPNHSNVGDSAIWLGELAWLRELGVNRLDYAGEASLYCRRRLAQKVGDGTILLHGGGNFGDLWPYHQRFRERVVQDFPDNPIVVLPQTVHFAQSDNLERAAEIFNRHPRLTLFVRDTESAERLQPAFRAPVVMSPDPALFLSVERFKQGPSDEVLLLARTDLESSGAAGRLPAQWRRADWLDERLSLGLRVANAAQAFVAKAPCRLEPVRAWLSGRYEDLGWQRVARGCRLLSQGRVVVTDRLHAHILCVLLGIPHVVLDNNYGKVGRFHRLWTHDVGFARLCDRPEDAPGLARQLARQYGEPA